MALNNVSLIKGFIILRMKQIIPLVEIRKVKVRYEAYDQLLAKIMMSEFEIKV